MMSSYSPRDEQPFVLSGQFLGFLLKDGYKIKYIKVLAQDREWLIEVSKPLRKEIPLNLPVGEWIQLSGWRAYGKYSIPKLKADALTIARPGQSSIHLGERPAAETMSKEDSQRDRTTKPKSTGKILVCGKSDCWKRGGKAVCGALKDAVSDHHLDGQVSVQTVGCMKQCKKGPNLVVMPDKQRYSRVSPNEVNRILDTHFVPVPESEPANVS